METTVTGWILTKEGGASSGEERGVILTHQQTLRNSYLLLKY